MSYLYDSLARYGKVYDLTHRMNPSTFLQVTVVFSYLRHTIEKHGNAQQSVREAVFNSQLGQVNPIKPRRFINELSSLE